MFRAGEMRDHAHMNNTMLRAIVGVFVVGFLSLSASGQAQTENVSLQAELLKDWIGLKETMHKIAAEMPADKYSFKPTPAQQTFGERTVHVATTNVYFLGLLGGTADETHDRSQGDGQGRRAQSPGRFVRLRRRDPETADRSDLAAVRGLGPQVHGPLLAGENHRVPRGPHLGHLRTDGGVSALEWPGAAGEPENVARWLAGTHEPRQCLA